MRNIQNKSGAEISLPCIRPRRSPRTLLFGPRHWNADPDHRREAKIWHPRFAGSPRPRAAGIALWRRSARQAVPTTKRWIESRLFGFRRSGGLIFGSRQPAPDAKRVDEQKHGVLDEKRTLALQPSVYHPGDRSNDKDRKSRNCNAGVPVRRHQCGREDRCSGRESSERCQFHFRCTEPKAA